MIQFAEVFADAQIVATLSRELSWSHFIEILPLKQPLEREFYAEMCRIERWSVRTCASALAASCTCARPLPKARGRDCQRAAICAKAGR